MRPTGFFSFFVEQLKMAARGRAILIGDGSAHTNPIDERDLSAICSISPRAFVTMAQPLSLINKRLHALCMFGASVSTIECVAPRQGHRSLGEYFAERAASASSGKTTAPISALA